jgi:hypothetical protein
MIRNARFIVAAALLAGPSLIALAQVSISPPAPGPATTQAAPAAPHVAPTTRAAASAPADTLPSAQSVLQGLINNPEAIAPPPPPPSPAATNPALTPTMEAVAPNTPSTNRLHEGQIIQDRVGRLVPDEKTGTYIIEFDADGKGMADPPMGLLPSRMLASMEDASAKGTKPVKFKVTGEVTEYRGKNYLLVMSMQAIADYNQGIGR